MSYKRSQVFPLISDETSYCRLERMPLVRYYSRKIKFLLSRMCFVFLLKYRLLQYFVGFASLRVLTNVCTN